MKHTFESDRTYLEFLEQKQKRFIESGFDCGMLNKILFPFQEFIVRIALKVQPIAIFEIIEGWKEVNKPHKNYTYRNSDNLEEHFTLIAHHFFTIDLDAEESIIFKFMDDAWHWYIAYMKWEDEHDNL